MRALRPCAVGETGDTVADLHEALQHLDADARISEGEFAANRFGEGTAVAIREFCDTHGIAPPAGLGLDQATADAINQQLVHAGILYAAYGPIVGVGGGVPQNSLVFGFDVDFVGGAQIAETATTGDQTYRLLYDPSFYRKPGPGHEEAKDTLALVILVYAADGRELARSEVKQSPDRDEEMPLYARNVQLWEGDGRPDDPWHIRGVVEDDNGRVAGVRVVAHDRDLGDQRQLLGHADTNADGEFAITYRAADFAAAEAQPRGTGPDLLFELTAVDDGDVGWACDVYRVHDGVRLAATPDELLLGIQAGRDEEVALRLRDPLPHRAVEYRRLMQALSPLLRDRSPAVLDETNHHDITFAARETGQNQSLIAALVIAHQLAETVLNGQVAPDLLYGLARCDRHLNDAVALALAGATALTEGIQQSIDRAVIGPHPADEIDAAVRYIAEVGPEILRQGPAGEVFGQVLAAAAPDPAAQRALLSAAAGRQDDPAAMWDELRAHPAFAEPGAIERAQTALQLDALTGRHVPLVTALIDHGVRSVRDLLTVDIAAIVADAGAPDGVLGEDDDQRTHTYASALAGLVHQAFPTLSVALAVKATPAEVLGGEEVKTVIADTLTRVEGMADGDGAFDLGRTHLDSFLDNHHELFAEVGDEVRGQALAELKRVQRLYRISTSPQAMNWLLASQQQTAFAITRYSRQEFIAAAAPAVDAEEAALMHDRAQRAADALMATHLSLLDARFAASTSTLADRSEDDHA